MDKWKGGIEMHKCSFKTKMVMHAESSIPVLPFIHGANGSNWFIFVTSNIFFSWQRRYPYFSRNPSNLWACKSIGRETQWAFCGIGDRRIIPSCVTRSSHNAGVSTKMVCWAFTSRGYLSPTGKWTQRMYNKGLETVSWLHQIEAEQRPLNIAATAFLFEEDCLHDDKLCP